MTEPHMRLASRTEAGALIDLQASAVLGLARAHYSPRQIEAFLEDASARVEAMLSATRLWVFVERSGDLIASAGWRVENAGTATARSIFTRPGWNGRGLARRLLQTAEREAALAGARRMELLAMRGSEPFYLSLGYQPEGEGSLDLAGIPFPGRFMAKPLTELAVVVDAA